MNIFTLIKTYFTYIKPNDCRQKHEEKKYPTGEKKTSMSPSFFIE